MKPVTVYALFSSEDGVIRYIGQTTQSLSKRLDSHIHCPKPARRRHLYHWIHSVLKAGYRIQACVLRTDAAWIATERELIRAYRALGVRLVNATNGGEGSLGGMSLKTRHKISQARMGMKFTDVHRANIAKARRGIPLSEDAKAKISATMKGRVPKNIAVLHASVRGKPKSEEHKMKLRNSRLASQRTRKEAA